MSLQPAGFVPAPLGSPGPEKEIFFTIETDGRISRSFGGGLGVLGYREGELEGRNVFEEFADDPAGLEQTRLALAGIPLERIFCVRGEEFLMRMRPRHDPEGRFLGISGHATPLMHCTDGEVRYIRDTVMSCGLLARGVYRAPYLDARSGSRPYLLIDRESRLVHTFTPPSNQDPERTAAEAYAMLDMLDQPADQEAA